MFNTGSESSKVRRLLRAAMPVTPSGSLALRRLSPLLLLAAALVALAVFFAPGAQPAKAQTQATTIWSATLTVKSLTVGGFEQRGCFGVSGSEYFCSANLDNDSFSYQGTTYTIEGFTYYVDSTDLHVDLSSALPSPGTLTLSVGGNDLTFTRAEASGDRLVYANANLNIAAGDTVELSLTAPPQPTLPTLPAGTTTHWQTTLTAKTVDFGLGVGGFGCGYRTGQPQCDDELANDVITHNGVDYEVELVHVAYGDTLQFILDKEPPGTLQHGLALYVNDRRFNIADAMESIGIADGGVWTNEDAWVLTWTGSGLTWSANQQVSLILATPPVGGL